MSYSAEEAEAILADPDGHFPYKKDDAIEGHVDPTTGIHYKVPVDEAESAAALVAAQAAALSDPSPEADAEVDRLMRELQDIRADRRSGKKVNEPVLAETVTTKIGG